MERLDHDCPSQSNHVDLALMKPPTGSRPIKYTNYAFKSMIGETLGIASIAANVRRDGHSVYYLDAYFEEMTVQEAIDDVTSKSPLVVGILLRYPCIEVVKRITNDLRLRLPGVVIVIGGQFPSINSQNCLEWLPAIDGVCIGEGEMAMIELMSAIKDGSPLPSRFEWRGRKATSTSKLVTRRNQLVSPLDGLAWPDRKYLQVSKEFGYGAVGISSARGCPFRCTFCVPHVYSQTAVSNPWNHRSAASIADEIEYHYNLGERSFTFSDEHFLPNKIAKRRAIEFADLLIERGLTELKFMFDCRADSIEYDLFEKLRNAGLYRVFIGFEAAKNSLLDDIRKDQNIDDYTRSISILKKLEIEVIPGMIMFTPTTTLDDVEANLSFYSESFDTFSEEDYVSDLEVISNTPAAHRLAARGLLTGLQNGVHSWRFNDPLVEAVWNDFNEALSLKVPAIRNLGEGDKRGIIELKREIESELFAILRSRRHGFSRPSWKSGPAKPPGLRYIGHAGFSPAAVLR